jgi:DNA-binding NtrC family response regulator
MTMADGKDARPSLIDQLRVARETAERAEKRMSAHITSRREPPSPARVSGTRPRVGCNVLIVEDNPTLASTLESLLHDEGYVTRTARSIAGARDRIGAEAPDVALLDLTLLDGFAEELLRELVAAHVPTVIISTFPSADVIAVRYGVALVRKPFELQALLEVLDRARGTSARASIAPRAR